MVVGDEADAMAVTQTSSPLEDVAGKAMSVLVLADEGVAAVPSLAMGVSVGTAIDVGVGLYAAYGLDDGSV